jgi:integrase/recombinase XerD
MYVSMAQVATEELRLEQVGGRWQLAGPAAEAYGLVNEYLNYLADRNYSSATVRAYGFDLLAFCRWLANEGVSLEAVATDVLLRWLAACRAVRLPGRPAPNVVSVRGERLDSYAATTINHRLAAVSGLFAFRAMRDPDKPNPVPRGREAHRVVPQERQGLLGHLVRRPRLRSPLRLREPRRLPRALDRDEVKALLESLRSYRDRAMAGLMLLCGLRAGEVLALHVTDVDVGARWLYVMGKGAKERRVPLDVDVAGLIQTYLLAERPDTVSKALFVVAKGPNRGQPLTPAGLRTIFRYHRARAGVPAGHPHALRHTFGTALAEAGVDLAVMQALLGHTYVDTTARYIHVAPARVKKEFDAAQQRLRTRS